MAADPSSSCDDGDELVELGAACDLDDATKRAFFSDGASVGASFSWPAAEGIASSLTSQASLRALCDKHGVPMEFRPVCADQWAACKAPPVGSNAICVYAAALDAGLCFPLHDFYSRVLRHFRLAPRQLTPNAWSYLAAFVLLCKQAGVEPLVSAFRYFFKIYARRHDGNPAGWHHFQPYAEPGRRLFTGSLPTKSEWKSKFFLEGPSVMQWKCLVKWGKPRMDAARKVEPVTAVDKLKLMGIVDVRCFLASRKMPVGEQVSLHAPVKAEAGASATAAESARHKRKPPPMSAPPKLASFRVFRAAGGSRGEPVPPQQQSCAMSTTPVPQGPGFPHRMCTSDALQLWEAIAGMRTANAKAEEQAAKAAKLSEELRLVRTWNAQYQSQLAMAQAMHEEEYAQIIGHLRAASGEVAQLKAEHAADLAQLKEEHAAEIAQLKEELLAENAQLREELLAEAIQLKDESYAMGWRDRGDELKTELHLDNNHMGCSLVTAGSPLVTADDH